MYGRTVVVVLFILLQNVKINSEPINITIHSKNDLQQRQIDTNTNAPLGSDIIKSIDHISSITSEQQTEAIDRQLAKYTLWLVVVTLILVVVGAYQAYIVRDTSRRQLRAYVYISCETPHEKLPEGVMAEFSIKNAGETPAYEVDYWMYHELREYPLVTELNNSAPDDFTFPSILPKGTEYNVHPEVKLTETEMQALLGGTKAYYFWGQIQYRDTFRTKRVTKFAFMATGQTERICLCPNGNEST
jgi:hypothetical protein